ncbi:class I SAM-dependent methyltransferase [Streptomyces boncukensis]|uniref:Class I SAM-dependent methyltransferase n=1 Tax=Streptomyces boncukensis TaxID=2711219 RepID=A0A6G4WVA6_9ACTN|nr:class I SAM-dependent methyltransferase [Streptomyces boncukensis]NGO69219.1 class I SAM-dependent methyltransferase [Streptomyces boncukensis]
MATADEDLVAEQITYYRARASEYDRVYAEREDLRELLTVTDDLPITGDTLELACGTGQWTQALATRARTVTALDASPEVLDIARTRAASSNVRFCQADILTWQPPRCYDTAFFAFWLSHVPPNQFTAFWTTVATALAPHGKAVFIDEGPAEAVREEVAATVRQLGDGSRYRIVKIFHDPGTLTADLTALGWSADIHLRGNFLIGIAEPPATPA